MCWAEIVRSREKAMIWNKSLCKFHFYLVFTLDSYVKKMVSNADGRNTRLATTVNQRWKKIKDGLKEPYLYSAIRRRRI